MNRVSIMGEFAASLAHEILHPIATALNNARAGMRFLEMRPPNLTEVKEALNCIVRDADREKDIVGRMRDHMKKAPPQRERFATNQAIREVIVKVRSVIDRKRVAVSTQITAGFDPVRADRVQLQQVVLNLVLNAVEAISSVEKGPRDLLISTKHSRRTVYWSPCMIQGQEFIRTDSSRFSRRFTARKRGGMGMGLSICRSIIATHGGRLWAEASRPLAQYFSSPCRQTGRMMTSLHGGSPAGAPNEGNVRDRHHLPACRGSNGCHPRALAYGRPHPGMR